MSLMLRTANRSKDDIKEAITFLNQKLNSYPDVGALAADTDFVYKAGVLVRELAQDQFALTDPTDMLLDRVTGPSLGDHIEFEEWINTSRVVERSLGGKPKVFIPHKAKYSYTMQDWRIDFGFLLERVATRQLDASVWVNQMAEAISRYMVSNTLRAIDTACADGVTDAYGRAVRTDSDPDDLEAAVDEALRRLGDVNPNVVIAGRYYALYPLFGLDGGSDNVPEEFKRRGAVGTFRGATLVVLRDDYNRFYSAATIPSDRLYIAGAQKGGILAETDLSAWNYTTVDQEELHFRVGTKGRTAFKVFKPWLYQVIDMSE
jgi:hypothetical protein